MFLIKLSSKISSSLYKGLLEDESVLFAMAFILDTAPNFIKDFNISSWVKLEIEEKVWIFSLTKSERASEGTKICSFIKNSPLITAGSSSTNLVK